MALLPSRTKYRKVHKGRIYGVAQKGNELSFGDFGIQSLSRGTMLFEIAGCSASAAREALRLADTKLPFRCRFVSREEV